MSCETAAVATKRPMPASMETIDDGSEEDFVMLDALLEGSDYFGRPRRSMGYWQSGDYRSELPWKEMASRNYE